MVSAKPGRIWGCFGCMQEKHTLFSTAIAVLFIFTTGICFASDSGSSVVDILDKARIDWTAGYYYATGEGAMPSDEEEPNRAKAYLKAKSYARMAAIANLFMAIEGTSISYYAVGKDYMVTDTLLRQRIEGYVANVEAVDEKRESVGGDTLVSVTVRCPMFGANGPGGAILRSKSVPLSPSGVKIDKRLDSDVVAIDSSSSGPYTSLLVDCTGLQIQRALAPKLRRPSGEEALGTVEWNVDILVDKGLVAYATTLEQALGLPRAGSAPLLVRAIARAGGTSKCDPVISDADADRIKIENETARFLENCSIIFIVGPGSNQ